MSPLLKLLKCTLLIANKCYPDYKVWVMGSNLRGETGGWGNGRFRSAFSLFGLESFVGETAVLNIGFAPKTTEIEPHFIHSDRFLSRPRLG